MNLKVILLTIIYTFFGVCAQPLSEEAAQWIALGSGTVTGVAAGVVTYNCLDNSKKTKRIIISCLVGLATGGVVGLCVLSICRSYTPQAKLTYARRLIARCQQDSLVSRTFNNAPDVVNHATARFGTNWPLVEGRQHLNEMRDELNSAISLLNASHNEIHTQPEHAHIAAQCLQERNNAVQALETLENRLTSLITARDYNFQVNLYATHKAQEEERNFQARERERERNFQSQEKGRDRSVQTREGRLNRTHQHILDQQKIDFAQNHDGPITVNI